MLKVSKILTAMRDSYPENLAGIMEMIKKNLELWDSSNPNSGHGHVFPRPDGVHSRCGSHCQSCAEDLRRKVEGGRILVARGVKLPEWSEDLWFFIRTKLSKDYESYLQGSRISVGNFLQSKGVDIPLKTVVIRIRKDEKVLGTANLQAQEILCLISSEDVKSSNFETLRGTFMHELGHMLDQSLGYMKSKKSLDTDDDHELTMQHARIPTEWRAYAAEIQDDLYRSARYPFTSEDTVGEYLFDYSKEWRVREPYLEEAARRYILEIFAKMLINKPDTFSAGSSFEKFVEFKTFGQYVMVAYTLQKSDLPFADFLMDQIEDGVELGEGSDPLHLDVGWLNYRMDYFTEAYQVGSRLINAWIRYINDIIEKTPETSSIPPCAPLKNYVRGLYLSECKEKYPQYMDEPYKAVPEGFGREFMRFTDDFCNRHDLPYWQNTLEDAFGSFRKNLREKVGV